LTSLVLIILFVICCPLFAYLGAIIGYRKGHKDAWVKSEQYFNDYIDRLEGLLKRAGLSLSGEIHPSLKEDLASKMHGSWTGQKIPDEVKRPAGTVPSWSEPSGHKK
jgi:hypothetical protein